MPEQVEEVRYQCLRPRQIVARRTKLPLAWLPLGILEWHGPQNPVGLDALKAEAVLCHVARKIGGLVMPTVWWGDHRDAIAELAFNPKRSPWYPQHMPDQTAAVAKIMRVPVEELAREADRRGRAGGWRVWTELVVHIFFEIESLGFRCITCYAGHAPLWKPLDEAAAAYASQGGRAKVFTLGFPGGEDHAAVRETSLMMALCPGLADLNELDPACKQHPGVMGEDPLKATPELGWEMVAKFEAAAREKLAGWLASQSV